jgi:hypothetical protein
MRKHRKRIVEIRKRLRNSLRKRIVNDVGHLRELSICLNMFIIERNKIFVEKVVKSSDSKEHFLLLRMHDLFEFFNQNTNHSKRGQRIILDNRVQMTNVIFEFDEKLFFTED